MPSSPLHLIPGLILLAAAHAVAAPETKNVAGSDSRSRACVDVREVNGWSVLDDRTILLRAGARRQYRVELGPSAETAGLGSQSNIVLVPNSSGDLCARSGRLVVDGRRLLITGLIRLDEPKG